MEVEARQPLGDVREEQFMATATSVFNPPVLLGEHPQNHRSLEKGFDVISGPTHAFLQSHLSPWASSKARRGAWRPCHVPGCRWAVGGGPCAAERGAGGLRPRHATWLLAAFVAMPRDCCWPEEMLYILRRTPPSSFQRFYSGFGGWVRDSKLTLPSLQILKMLSGCPELRRTRMKFEGFKGKASISNY